jgi:TPR repeat protein
MKKLLVILFLLGGLSSFLINYYDNHLYLHPIYRTAEKGDVQAQNHLGYIYRDRQNYQEAVYWFKKAAEQGNTIAQFNLGVMYDKGQGVRQDYQKAFYWYKKSAAQGNSMAQENLGAMYYNGQGVRQDISLAKEYFGKACDNGLEKDCNYYKTLNEQGY